MRNKKSRRTWRSFSGSIPFEAHRRRQYLFFRLQLHQQILRFQRNIHILNSDYSHIAESMAFGRDSRILLPSLSGYIVRSPVRFFCPFAFIHLLYFTTSFHRRRTPSSMLAMSSSALDLSMRLYLNSRLVTGSMIASPAFRAASDSGSSPCSAR